MTAAVIVLLAQEGKLRFEDPVSKYVSGVPNGDDITIGELLKMRSGLPSYTEAPELTESLDHDPARVWTPEEMLAIAFKRPSLFAPGTEFSYCNTNYALLGLIIEKLEGAPLARVLQDRLFGPLGMKHTLLPANTSNAIPEPYAHGYLYGSSSYALVDAPYPADLQVAAKAGTLKPNDDTDQTRPTPWPPEAPSPPRMISPCGYVRWPEARFSILTRSANGSTALSRRTPRPEIWVWDLPDHLRAEQPVFSRRRNARLQLVHGLRSSQRCHFGDMDQPDGVAGRSADGQHP
jgi:CubicO group peptidase (beta-lactamase class C family)